MNCSKKDILIYSNQFCERTFSKSLNLNYFVLSFLVSIGIFQETGPNKNSIL